MPVPHVGRGFFPLDEQLKLQDLHWSEELAREMVWLSGLVAFGDAAEILQEIGQIRVSKSSVWRIAQKWGEEFRKVEKEHTDRANALPGREQIVAGEASGIERLGTSMDGAMMYILEEGWKELKVGTVFSVEAVGVVDKVTLGEEQVGRAQNVSYVAYLGGPEEFGRLLWAEAHQREWSKALDTQVVGDGAAWIWNQVADHFFDSYQLVDWYHATEHLARAAEALYGDQVQARQRWLNEQKQSLFQGQAEVISQLLSQRAEEKQGDIKQPLLQEAGYFENHKRRMNYLEMRMEGWLIGSGTVESGDKQYKERFTGPGMRWKRVGAEHLIPIRSAIMTGNFHQRWKAIYNSPRN
jgi:hypothetical protein